MTSDSNIEPLRVSRWIPIFLTFAAIYNLLWCAFIILFPTLPFRLGGMTVINYPVFMQAMGLFVGLFGVGYGLAARDPIGNWSVVLIGLLSKILWPVLFVVAAFQRELPWSNGWSILVNDVAWWLPLAAILMQVARVKDSRHADQLMLSDVLRDAKTERGDSLLELSQKQPLLVVCVRHMGCTYCREALDELAHQRGTLDAQGVKPVIVHMGTSTQGEDLLRRYGCAGMDHVSDPNRQVYQALQLRLGTLSQVLGFKAFWRALAGGTIFRYGFGRIVGNGLQLAGAVVIRDGQIVKAFRHQSSADRADVAELVCSIR